MHHLALSEEGYLTETVFARKTGMQDDQPVPDSFDQDLTTSGCSNWKTPRRQGGLSCYLRGRRCEDLAWTEDWATRRYHSNEGSTIGDAEAEKIIKNLTISKKKK